MVIQVNWLVLKRGANLPTLDIIQAHQLEREIMKHNLWKTNNKQMVAIDMYNIYVIIQYIHYINQ